MDGEDIEPRASLCYISEKCNSKSRKLQSNDRKLSELEKRQLRLISRLDEAEKKLHDLFRVPVLDVEEFPDLKMGMGSNISERQSKQIREPDFKLPLKGR